MAAHHGTRAPSEGFTLIELLVVIAIIGLLSSVILASLNAAREKSRDAQRKLEVAQIQQALELYYTANHVYPCASGSCNVSVNTLGAVAGPALVSAGDIAAVPQDPIYSYGAGCNNVSESYCYCSQGGDSYVLTVNTEDDKGGSPACHITVGPNASALCTGHWGSGKTAEDDCSARF
ncbi:MAG TPA: prepilin-type N-terminal cleavage/methylation domain-containing protein [Candidatus Paceibacterota bacterium]|nr:prepilin-type N-terminal cleavage/methylation domain-containing protein [Candidatus Paceibacterota bacterium]